MCYMINSFLETIASESQTFPPDNLFIMTVFTSEATISLRWKHKSVAFCPENLVSLTNLEKFDGYIYVNIDWSVLASRFIVLFTKHKYFKY